MLASIKPRRRPQHHEQIHSVFVKIGILSQARKDLSPTLTVAQVGDFLLICLLSNILQKSRLVVPSQLLEAPVPELRIVVRVEILVVAGV